MRGTPPDDRKVPPEFGLLLRTLRAGEGLSQDGLAERAGISPKTIGALEQGVRRAAHDDTIRRIATALELRSEDREALLQAARHSRAHRLAQAEGLKTNLPSPLTSFIERPEVEEISALLGSNRLVTITGTGGVGKTRTAIEVAHRAKGSNHRFWFVDLSRLRDGSTILSELTNVLGIGVGDAGDEYAAVVRYLSARPSHLLFDNCEHLLEDLAGLVIRLFQSCPSLTILVTSREPLALSFETSYRLPVLDVPNGRIAEFARLLSTLPYGSSSIGANQPARRGFRRRLRWRRLAHYAGSLTGFHSQLNSRRRASRPSGLTCFLKASPGDWRSRASVIIPNGIKP